MRQSPDDEDYDDAAPQSGPVGRMLSGASTYLGAALAVVLLVGGGLWLYRLGVRDAANVPVIRASLDPSKELPEEPGGVETPHQDIGSYSLADSTPAEPPKPGLAPPPVRPTDVDLAPAALLKPEISAATVTTTPAVPAPVAPVDQAAPVAQVAPVAVAAPQPAPEPTAAPEPEVAVNPDLTRAVEEALAEAAATQPSPGSVVGATPQAPTASPPARARPADLAARVADAGRAATAEAAALTVAAAQSGIKLQLGAFPSRSFTEEEWGRISRANPDLLGGRRLIIETTVTGGATWYRLRVGPFRDRAEANSICAALKARNQDCIVALNG